MRVDFRDGRGKGRELGPEGEKEPAGRLGEEPVEEPAKVAESCFPHMSHGVDHPQGGLWKLGGKPGMCM